MPVFHRLSFDADELDALRQACASLSAHEDRLLDEATAGSLEDVVAQKSAADDLLLLKSTVSLFKPGQTVLVTKEDLCLMRKCLEHYKKESASRLFRAIDSALGKINAAKPAGN